MKQETSIPKAYFRAPVIVGYPAAIRHPVMQQQLGPQ